MRWLADKQIITESMPSSTLLHHFVVLPSHRGRAREDAPKRKGGAFPILIFRSGIRDPSASMAQGTHVPKFGNWEGDEADDTVSFPYTQYFEKAHKGRKGTKAMNADNPRDNPEEFHADATLIHAAPLTSSPHLGSSPLHHDPIIHKHTIDSPNNRYEDQMPLGDYQSRLHQVGDGSDYKGNASPLHPRYPMNNNVYSTSEGLSEGNYGSNSPGGLRMAGVGDENIIKKGRPVPKFGEWNENPCMADGYSIIFSKVREDKEKDGRQTRPATVPNVPNDTTEDNSQENSHESATCSCFGWCKK